MHPPPYPASWVIPPPAPGVAGEQPIGWFDMSKPGQYGSRAFLDFVFQSGLYKQKTDGTLEVTSIDVLVEFQQVDDAGIPFGAITSSTQTFTGDSNTPQRFTRTFDLPAAGRWRCRCRRTTLSDLKTSTSDRITWSGLKLQVTATPNTQVCYGVVTLLAIRIKASNGITSEAAARIRVYGTRRLRFLADPAQPLTQSHNPADAFCAFSRPTTARIATGPRRSTCRRCKTVTPSGWGAMASMPCSISARRSGRRCSFQSRPCLHRPCQSGRR